MPTNRYSYTVEKLTSAIDCLVTHPGDVRERLTCAYLGFHTLTENDFPPNLRADWRWVMKELTKFGEQRNHKGEVRIGSVENTMQRVRKATGVKISKKIYALYWAVSENTRYL
jgi:hypothetical protein